MEKTKRKSAQFSKRTAIVKPLNNQSKTFAQRELYESGLMKIFSSPPSHHGYQFDIETLINELGLKNEQLLNFTLSSLSKIARNKNEIRIIASYLYLMPNFIKLLNGPYINKKDQDILKQLLYLSQSLSYEKLQKNSILMRFGDKGTTAYVILDGKVDVLIKSFKYMIITKNDYLYYLATLLKYSEYGLLNEVINENFSTFPIEIFDNINIKHLQFNKISDSSINIEKNIKTVKNLDDSPNLKIKKKNSIFFSESKTLTNLEEEKSKNNEDMHNSSFNSLFKLNEENEQIKEFKSVFTITTSKLLKMFNMKKLEKRHTKLHSCTIEDYINRIELIPDNFKRKISDNFQLNEKNKEKNKDLKEKGDNNKIEEIVNESEDEEENKFYNLKIFTYNKVATLGKGSLFGEIALRDPDSLRTGTIITASECHFTVLSRKIYDNCLKKGAEKYLKEVLNFIINLPVFSGIPESLFYHKYYTYLSKKIILRGNLIITQGEKPKNIILLQTGAYGLTTRISLYDLTKLINHFINMNSKNKNSIIEEENNKYNKLLKKTKKLMTEANSLMNENLKFKKFYLSEIFIRVTDISCPDIVGYKEYLDENGLYAFSIETKSPENIIFSLENKFYNDLQHKNYTVRINQKELLAKKIDAIIQRLLIIRNSLFNSFFDNKGEKELNSKLLKELENISISKLKQKRFLKFKSTEYKFNKKSIDEKDYENIKINNGSKKDRNKYKKIKISRNNLYYFNSFNENEAKTNNIRKNIKLVYSTNNKKNKKVINLCKSSKNNYSDKQSIKKSEIIDKDSKEKSSLSNQTLQEYKYKLISKENTKTDFNSKNIYKLNNIKYDKIYLLESPKLYSASNSCRSSQIKGVIFNSLVWEEIKTKINKGSHIRVNEKINYNNEFTNTFSCRARENQLFKNLEKSHSFQKFKINNNEFSNTSSYRGRENQFFKNLEKSNSLKKLNNNEITIPFNSCRNSSNRIRFDNNEGKNILKNKYFEKPSLLHKSSSELSLKNNIRIKSSLLNKINKQKINTVLDLKPKKGDNSNENYKIKKIYSPEKESVPKINLKIKKLFSPEQIKLIREINQKRNELIKYHENKFKKYRLERKFYYNNNLKNRMKFFFDIGKK